ncbi:sigma-70 family RNA polymerase sigma factor [Pseudohongiella sp. SYSU M77423]|uniref:RNA polymerase sigma factor n=1 Tax=Pseudohongiella sp. SYSU M77423 TaxID=3042312 RepID=UPI0024810D24|nr:sigma-70 family RNA polymerase sigma factor [Pseudohongiella sp. SYSU M77423]MDH7943733.1 sigma-70 family RNA polymerase sigma factor [Pseudohongiella sp. SYSU M77423]
MQQAEEELLVLEAQDGDNRAFQQLFQRYQNALLRYGYKVSGDRQIAQDAAQEAWFRLARNIRQLDDPKAFKSWMYQLVHWSCIDLLKKTRDSDQQLDVSDVEPEFSDDNSEQQESLNAAINRLPSLEKQMIHLFYLEEMSVRQVAQVLRISEGTVKSRLNRARRLLKERFDV